MNLKYIRRLTVCSMVAAATLAMNDTAAGDETHCPQAVDEVPQTETDGEADMGDADAAAGVASANGDETEK